MVKESGKSEKFGHMEVMEVCRKMILITKEAGGLKGAPEESKESDSG